MLVGRWDFKCSSSAQKDLKSHEVNRVRDSVGGHASARAAAPRKNHEQHRQQGKHAQFACLGLHTHTHTHTQMFETQVVGKFGLIY